MTTLEIDLDTSASPSLAEWGEQAVAIAQEWWPQVLESLGQPAYRKQIRLVVRPEVGPPAYWNGTEIHCDEGHFTRQEDFGAVVHEVVHVAQGYPSYEPGWLVEGIADYVRYCVMEPGSRWATADLSQASYTNGYGPCGVFLGWLCKRYDESLVQKLDAALKAGTYTEQVVRDACDGKGFDELWPAFLDTRPTAA